MTFETLDRNSFVFGFLYGPYVGWREVVVVVEVAQEGPSDVIGGLSTNRRSQ